MAGSGVPLRLHTVGVQAPRGESTVLVRCPVLCRDANRFVEAVGGGEHLEQYLRRHRGSSDGSGPDSLNFALRPGSRGARPLKGATELVDAVVLKVVTRRYRSGRKERVVKPVRVAGRMVHFSGAADLQYLTRAELGVPEPLPALNPADAAPPSGFDATSEARAGAYYKEHHDQVAKEGGVAQGAPAASTPQSIGTLQVSEAACSLDASDQVDKDVSAHRVCDLLEHEVECLPDAFFGATPPAPPATEPDSLFLGHAPGGRSATWDALKIVLAFHDECPAPVQAVPAALARPARSEVISAPRAHTLLSERHAVTTLHRHMRELRAHVALLRLFRARPVWTPRALCTYVRPGILPPRPALPRFLRRVAYFSRMVPWRGCWIRFGYDPRRVTSGRFFQAVDVRLGDGRSAPPTPSVAHPQGAASGAAADGGSAQSTPAEGSTVLAKPLSAAQAATWHAGDEARASLLDPVAPLLRGRPPRSPTRHLLVQFCDLDMPDLVERMRLADVAVECNERTGWFHPDLMRSLVASLRAQWRGAGNGVRFARKRGPRANKAFVPTAPGLREPAEEERVPAHLTAHGPREPIPLEGAVEVDPVQPPLDDEAEDEEGVDEADDDRGGDSEPQQSRRAGAGAEGVQERVETGGGEGEEEEGEEEEAEEEEAEREEEEGEIGFELGLDTDEEEDEGGLDDEGLFRGLGMPLR